MNHKQKLKKASKTRMQLKFQCIKRIIKSRKFLAVSKNNLNTTSLQETHTNQIFKMYKYESIGKNKSGTRKDRNMSGNNNIFKS